MTALLRTIVPSGVVVVEGPLLAEELHLSDMEMVEIGGAGPARRLEFLTGRLYARKALASVGVFDHPVGVGPYGEPVWPEGIVGSISHSPTWCVVAVGPVAAVPGIGVHVRDLQLPVEGDVAGTPVASPEELDALRSAGVVDVEALAAAAKAAAYKARRPGRAFEFGDIAITTTQSGLIAEVRFDAPATRFEILWATGGSRCAAVALPT